MPKLTEATKSNPCPICAKPDWCYYLSDDLWYCKRSDDAPIGWRRTSTQDREGHWLFGSEASSDSQEWKDKKEGWERRKAERAAEEEANRLEAQHRDFSSRLTASERDPLIRALSKDLGLTSSHRQMLRGRELSDEAIETGLYFSVESWQLISGKYPLNLPGVRQTKDGKRFLASAYNKERNCYVGGIAIVTIDTDGMATGWQLMTVPRIKNKYIWASGHQSCHLPIGEGELPIQVAGIASKSNTVWGSEGILKARVAADRIGDRFMGAASGLFRSSPVQVKAALAGVKIVRLTPDAGDIFNPHRVNHWRLEAEFFKSLGIIVKFAWWGQTTKDKNDIDEITPQELAKIQFLAPEKFFKIADRQLLKIADRQLYDTLTKLSYKADDLRNEKFLQPIPALRPGFFMFIASGCGTGKTEQLPKLIDNWLRAHANGKVIDIVHRNSIKDGHQRRLNILEYKVGHGQNAAALNNSQKVSICSDSLLQLNLADIPAGSLVILDEVEAILNHLARGGTLGGNTARVQAHFAALINHVLSTGGAVVALEDSITDLAINGLLDLTGRIYPHELIVNTHERFNWNVSMGAGSLKCFIAAIVERLKLGERIIIPSSSQKFGEAVARLVTEHLPEITARMIRLDAKTAPDLHSLLRDPNGWFAARNIQLFIYTATIESGFSIDAGYFDRRMAYFANLETRSHIQLLPRERSNIPTDIFITERGAEAGGMLKNPHKLLKMQTQFANITSMAQGRSRIHSNSGGKVWNRLACEFTARATLSANHLSDYLETALLARGHSVIKVDWAEQHRSIAAQLADLGLDSESPDLLDCRFKAIKLEIEVEENEILYLAKGKSISPDQAIAMLHSSGVRFEERQKAIKCLLHRDFPGVELTREFLLEVVTKNRGRYRRECEFTWMLGHHEVANKLDRTIYNKQLELPHLLLSRVPLNQQKVELFAPVMEHIEDLASGRQYKEDDPAVLAIVAWALNNAYLIWGLLGLTITPESIDSNGRKRNNSIAIVNKILKKLGYTTESNRLGATGARERVYHVTNANCPHRQAIYEALELRYQDLMSAESTDSICYKGTELVDASTNLSSDDDFQSLETAVSNIELLVSQPLEDAVGAFVDFRSYYSSDVFNAAVVVLKERHSEWVQQVSDRLNDRAA